MLNTVVGVSKGIGRPFSLSSRGFGSNVSICEGPPSMKRKITDFALGAKCGDFGARGFVPGGGAAEANLSARRYASARPPNPFAHRHSISLRVTPGPKRSIRCGLAFILLPPGVGPCSRHR